MKSNRYADPSHARAYERVQELRSFYIGLIVYITLNSIFWAINLAQGGYKWAQWPTLGWGFSMFIWGLSLAGREGDWFFGAKWEARKVDEIMARENLRVVSGEKRLAQAQLRLLQAQIEPHFLFNTLANVQSLIGKSPDRASAMLDDFIGYLRRSLSASRADSGTLAQEFALLEHYLRLLKIRMATRLNYTIDLPEALKEFPLSPMLLQPVVENAIKHGLEPKAEGGDIEVHARTRGGMLVVSVADDGVGFAQDAVAGVGLANLRERLKLLYGDGATLTIADAQPGTCVQISLPLPT